jgi:hypothetical protein
MFILYPFLKIAVILITLIAWAINPVLVLFVDKDGNLPKYLYYFKTFDAPIPQGYSEGLAWLNRNPSYGFDLFVFGMKWVPEDWKVRKLILNDEKDFLFSTNKYGAFNIYYHNKKANKYLKFGWKSWNFLNHDTAEFTAMWPNSHGRVPIC